MKFAVYQIQLTDDQLRTINAKGFDAVPAKKAQLDMTMDFGGSKIGGLASDAWDRGYYTHVANITADNYNEVFEIGNIGPEQNIERLARMHSISVGDMIIGEDGSMAVVSSYGFTLIGFRPELVA
jgi:hypothetical protein